MFPIFMVNMLIYGYFENMNSPKFLHCKEWSLDITNIWFKLQTTVGFDI